MIDEKSLEELQKKFDSLSFKNQKKVFQAALTKSATILKNKTKANLRILKQNPASIRKRTALEKGIKHRTKLTSVKDMWSLVHIMGDYWLKWIEKGTSERRTKKGYNRGVQKGGYFFNKAQQETQSQVFSELENRINENILKIWKKENS